MNKDRFVAGDLWQLTATEVSRLILNNQITVEDYAISLIARIDIRDNKVKAWAYLNPELILSRARQLDALPHSQRGPLHGIAIGVKDIILTADMPTQYNSPLHYTTSPSTVDASCVQALRASGALIFGKTTTTELAATTIGNVNQNFTRNAHSEDRTPGGSSSGSAAAVADFQVPIALGTQTAGSVVRPASFNGIWGTKATWGAINHAGVGQYSVTCDTLGAFARSAEDLELVFKVLRVEDDMVPPALGRDSLEGARIGFCKTPVWGEKASSNLESVWSKAMEICKVAGAKVEELELPEDFAKIAKWHADVLAGEGRNSFLGAYLTDAEKLAPFLRGHVENVNNVSRKRLLEAYDGCARLRPVWDSIAGEFDAIVTPSVTDEAPIGLEYTGDAAFNSMWTILHAPTINVPGLLGSHGLPIGLTVVGARYADQRTLEDAKKIGKMLQARK